jgi:hypothetical protein
MGITFASRRGRKRKPTRPKVPQNELVPGRCVALFGPPQAGTSLLARVVQDETKTDTVLLKGRPDPDVILRARKRGVKVIFFDGFPQTVDDVQELFDQRWVTNIEGAVIRTVVDRGTVLRRLEVPPWDLEEFHESWARYESGLREMEERIRALSLPYFCIQLEDTEAALGDLARRCGIRD